MPLKIDGGKTPIRKPLRGISWHEPTFSAHGRHSFGLIQSYADGSKWVSPFVRRTYSGHKEAIGRQDHSFWRHPMAVSRGTPRMAQIPVISSHILHGLPDFLRHEIGERALLRANCAAGFDLELIEGRNCFIPHAAVVGFLNAAAKAAGEANLGVLLAPVMNAANYGTFGGYVLGADTLGRSIKRAIEALCYHSTDDKMSLAIVGDEARYSYIFALAGRAGYDILPVLRLAFC